MKFWYSTYAFKLTPTLLYKNKQWTISISGKTLFLFWYTNFQNGVTKCSWIRLTESADPHFPKHNDVLYWLFYKMCFSSLEDCEWVLFYVMWELFLEFNVWVPKMGVEVFELPLVELHGLNHQTHHLLPVTWTPLVWAGEGKESQ